MSFGIDGTLEVGDPPGVITMEMVRRAQQSGCVIGSCSDRPAAAQQEMWDSHDIEPDFVSLKYMLEDVRERFETELYIHVGHRNLDRQYAVLAGFEFAWPNEALAMPWLAAAVGPRDAEHPARSPLRIASAEERAYGSRRAGGTAPEP